MFQNARAHTHTQTHTDRQTDIHRHTQCVPSGSGWEERVAGLPSGDNYFLIGEIFSLLFPHSLPLHPFHPSTPHCPPSSTAPFSPPPPRCRWKREKRLARGREEQSKIQNEKTATWMMVRNSIDMLCFSFHWWHFFFAFDKHVVCFSSCCLFIDLFFGLFSFWNELILTDLLCSTRARYGQWWRRHRF